MELLRLTGASLYGKKVVIIGHSEIAGKPLSIMLLNEFATVSVCHIATSERGDIKEYIKMAQILIVAVGKPNLVKGDLIKRGAIVIDVGINRVKGEIIGDVEFEEAKKRASYISPVPGGVGPLTTAMLMRNSITLFKMQNGLA
jgi:methylenetetrahydrofolate dehydrogenase (NADP+)/methenyltetrahydrofolate cyclohydrolase